MPNLNKQDNQPHAKNTTDRPTSKQKSGESRRGVLRGAYKIFRPEVVQPDDPSKRHIALTKGQVAVVPAQIYDWLMESNWHATTDESRGIGYYAVRNSSTINGKKTQILMSREIVGLLAGDPREADHQNHDTLDNTGQNLRILNGKENVLNKRKYKTNKSGYKGVSWSKNRRKWLAQIQYEKRKIMLGCYDSKEEAARVYDRAAIKYFGKFACLNFPRSDYD